MKAQVTIHTLETDGSAYFNVKNDVYGCVQVWGSCYKNPTYLIKSKQLFDFMQFDNKETAAEYFKATPLPEGAEVILLRHDRKIQT